MATLMKCLRGNVGAMGKRLILSSENTVRPIQTAQWRLAQAQEQTPPHLNGTVTMTTDAVKQIHKITSDVNNGMLRVLVEGGGCSGFKYIFDVDNVLNSDDQVFERDGAKIVVDNRSMEFINGSEVTFANELIRSNFAVFNPNAEQGCTCGSSFFLKGQGPKSQDPLDE